MFCEEVIRSCFVCIGYKLVELHECFLNLVPRRVMLVYNVEDASAEDIEEQFGFNGRVFDTLYTEEMSWDKYMAGHKNAIDDLESTLTRTRQDVMIINPTPALERVVASHVSFARRPEYYYPSTILS